MQQAQGIQNYENSSIRKIGKGETRHRKVERLTTDQVTKESL
jgi:hypothetical protein